MTVFTIEKQELENFVKNLKIENFKTFEDFSFISPFFNLEKFEKDTNIKNILLDSKYYNLFELFDSFANIIIVGKKTKLDNNKYILNADECFETLKNYFNKYLTCFVEQNKEKFI